MAYKDLVIRLSSEGNHQFKASALEVDRQKVCDLFAERGIRLVVLNAWRLTAF